MRRKLVLSVFDQAVISAFNFAMNLFLIKFWSPEDFGFFTIIAAASIFATMVQNAVINTPLAVHLPIASSAGDKAVLRRVFSAANLLLCVMVLLLSWGVLVIWLGLSQPFLVLGASLYLGTQFIREYYRALLAVEGKLGALLIADLSYVVLSAGLLTYLIFSDEGQLQTISEVLLILSASGFLTMIWHLVPRQLPSLRALPGEIFRVFKLQMHEIRWSLLGVITTDIQNRGYLFVAAAVFGPATVAHLQAGRIFFGPLNLLTSAWARVARPQLAGMFGQGEVSSFTSLLRRALWSFVAFNMLFLVLLWFAWPYLTTLVFGDKYKGLGVLIAAWGIANVAFQIRSCLGIGVQALRRFRNLTLASIYGAIVSAVLVALACAAKEPAWLIASVIGGECVAIMVVLGILRNHLPEEGVTLK